METTTLKYRWSEIQDLDWVRALHDVPQNPVYHAEGDVHIHTGMVLEEMEKLPGYQALSQKDQRTLYLATAMHDIAKPICTKEENGQIVSPGHAVKGRKVTRETLYRGIHGSIGFHEREQIAQLVRYHGLPLWVMEKRQPQAELLKASLHCNLQWLALLAEADARGRECPDKDDLLERVELFREFCKEQGVWEGPYPFQNGHHRFEYFEKPDNGPLYVPFSDFKCQATILSGLPGSGKDHWIQEYGNHQPVVSLDGIRKELGISPKGNQGTVIQTAKERAKEHLRKGQSFIWNATNLSRDLRGPLIRLFAEYGAKIKIVYVEVPWETWRSQNQDREDVVPTKILDKMLRHWEVPELWEAHQIEYQVTD